jgi:hypothetical protein
MPLRLCTFMPLRLYASAPHFALCGKKEGWGDGEMGGRRDEELRARGREGERARRRD